MYIYFRTLKLFLTAKYDDKVGVWDEIERPMMVMPTDIDVSNYSTVIKEMLRFDVPELVANEGEEVISLK